MIYLITNEFICSETSKVYKKIQMNSICNLNSIKKNTFKIYVIPILLLIIVLQSSVKKYINNYKSTLSLHKTIKPEELIVIIDELMK